MKCEYCGKEAEYIDSKDYYGVSYGMIYLCRDCDAMVGTHKNSGKPLGRMANKELRELRKKAHNMLDVLWRNGYMGRQKVYELMYKETGVKHIGWTDINDCRKVISWLEDIV